MRTVTVRYLVPVFVDVDLDVVPDPEDGSYPDDAVVQVWEGDEIIVRLDRIDSISALIEGDVIVMSADEEAAVDPASLTAEERVKALDIAKNTPWPAWERG